MSKKYTPKLNTEMPESVKKLLGERDFMEETIKHLSKYF